MPVVKTEVIVLQSFPYSETSRILRYATPDLGVISVIAKGIRRAGGRAGGAPDVFSEGEATIYVKPQRELQTLREFALTRTRLGLAADLVRFGGAAVLTELVLRHAGEEPNRELFERLRAGLDRLESAAPAEAAAAAVAEAWRIVSLLGYAPELERCVACGSPLGLREPGRFDYLAGGVRCARCAGASAGPRIGPGARAQLRQLAHGEAPEPLGRLRPHLQLLRDFVRYHVSGGRALRSLEFLARQVER